jgi:DNA-binding beta-propeller fold protein YncE
MLTRRKFIFLVTLFSGTSWAGLTVGQDNERVMVRVRGDDTVRAVLPPIELKNLTIEPDNSDEAKVLSSRVPPGRAAPFLIIIAGAIAVTELLKMVRELYRQTYYGGVVVDTRQNPPIITNDPKIPADMVFVIDADGKTTKYTGDSFSLDALKLAFKIK